MYKIVVWAITILFVALLIAESIASRASSRKR
jgi:hypothetical protein